MKVRMKLIKAGFTPDTQAQGHAHAIDRAQGLDGEGIMPIKESWRAKSEG